MLLSSLRAVFRPSLPEQRSAVVAGVDLHELALHDSYRAALLVPLLAVEPFVDDKGECVGRAHALHGLRSARKALLPVCSLVDPLGGHHDDLERALELYAMAVELGLERRAEPLIRRP